MPEKEARPPAQNRHGGAPRGERVPLDARRASGSADRRAPATRDNRQLAPFGAPLAPRGVDGTEESKTRARKRAAGTKKTALFDIVNRNDAATRSVPPSARLGTSAEARYGYGEVQRDEDPVPPSSCGGGEAAVSKGRAATDVGLPQMAATCGGPHASRRRASQLAQAA